MLNGNLTGDIWHCAALQVLWKYCSTEMKGKKFPLSEVKRLQTVVTAYENKEGKCLENARKSFVYLHDLGLDPIAIKLKRKEKSRRPENSMYGLTALKINEINESLPKKLGTQPGKIFNELMEAQGNGFNSPTAKVSESENEPDLISLYQCSTALAQLTKTVGTKKSIEVIADGLTKNIAAADKNKAEAKAKELSELMKKGKTKTVLFNARKGQVNKQHDSSIELREVVEQAAKSKGMKVIGFGKNPEVRKKTTDIGGGDFELFDDEKHFPKKQFTAHFWRRVAKDPNCFGLIGGRSGSVDIASFVGVYCCQWDQPLFRRGVSSGPQTVQLPQLIRLLAQKPFTDVILLATKDKITKKAEYKSFETRDGKPELLLKWMKRGAPSEKCDAIPPGQFGVRMQTPF